LCLIYRLFACYAYSTIGYDDGLAAGVGIQAIVEGIVTVVAKNEKMLHVITENEDAFKVMTEIFELQQETEFQLKLDGHIFCAGHSVAERSG